jgi:hypothetical protein
MESITVRKIKRDAGPKHVGTEREYLVGGFLRSFHVADGIFPSPNMFLVLRHAQLF